MTGLKNVPISTWLTMAVLAVSMTGAWFTVQATVTQMTKDIFKLEAELMLLENQLEIRRNATIALKDRVLRLEFGVGNASRSPM